MDAELAAVLTRIESRLERLESTVALNSTVVALRDEMNTNFDGVYVRLDRLETEYHSISAGLTRLEHRVERLEARFDN